MDLELDIVEYLRLDARIKELEYEREAIKARLKKQVGEDKEVNINGYKVSNKVICSQTLDTKAIRTYLPKETLKPFIRENITTRFSVKCEV